MKPNPRLVAGGVASALLGGGVTAALLLGPTVGSAGTDTTEPPAEETEDSAGTESGTDEGTLDEAGAELREALQPLIDNGTLTEEQVDAIVDSVVGMGLPPINIEGPIISAGPGGPGFPGFPGDDRPGPGFPDGGFRPGRMLVGLDVIAETIGIDEETLIEELRGGATVAEIAEANGVDPQAVIDALVANYTEHVTDWVNGEADDAAEPETEETTETTTVT
jgi:hypothetical protein